MPRLPVLTAHNTLEYPLWHEYVARVYHQAPEGDASLDLNTFSFFYTGDAYPATTELLHGPRRDPCLRVCTLRSWPDRPPVYPGTPFVGDAGPEAGVGRIGFFVHREPPLSREEVMAQVAGGPEHGGTLEVMHVRTDWLGGEVGVSWFFYAVGSGVRLDVTRLPKEGAVAVFADRQEWRDRHGGAQWPGDDHIRGHMEADRLSMLVFTRAGFSVFNQAGNNPSTEIIVRHAHDDSSELHSERGSCLDAPAIGIRLRTGLTARGTLATLQDRRLPPSVENDCGEWCSAFAFVHEDIPFTHFSHSGYLSGLTMVFDASPDLWENHVQCLSTTDSFSSMRSCCACFDPHFCTFENPQNWRDFESVDSGYCGGPCAAGESGATCRQLAAGCGANLHDIAGKANGGDGNPIVGEPSDSWGDQTCGQWEIESGRCNLCTQPLWCDDPGNPFGYGGRINTPQKWIDEFFNKDGGRAFGARQCKWKPSQKQMFIDTMRLRFQRRAQLPVDEYGRHYDHANTWNEVNMYVDGGGVLASALWDHLIALLYIRTAGSDEDYANIVALRDHWRSLGREVPILGVSAEEVYPAERVSNWSPDVKVDLLQPPYRLELIE